MQDVHLNRFLFNFLNDKIISCSIKHVPATHVCILQLISLVATGMHT